MTKIERAKELEARASEMAIAARNSQKAWAATGDNDLAAQDRQDAELFELEAEMYGDLLRTYEKGDSTVETKCPGDGTEGES